MNGRLQRVIGKNENKIVGKISTVRKFIGKTGVKREERSDGVATY